MRGEAKGRLSALFQSSADAMVFATPDGLLLDVNEAFVRLTGFARGDVVHRMRYQEMTPPEWQRINREIVEKMFKSGSSQEFDQELVGKNGSPVPVHLKIFLVRTIDGKPFGMGTIIKHNFNRTGAA